MSQSPIKSNSGKEKDEHLYDQYGKIIPKRMSLRERLTNISTRVKVISTSTIILVTMLATFLINLENISKKIENITKRFQKQTSLPDIPAIIVKLSNTSEDEIIVATRSDFFLWFPGLGTRHLTGKYEFRNLDGSSIENGVISIKSNTTTSVSAHVLNEQMYGKLLEQAEYDISLIIYRINKGIKFTQNLPFTRESIKKYYISIDLGYE